MRLAERLGDGQAGVEGLELSKPGVARFDEVGDAVQDARTLSRQHLRPRSVDEGAARSGDGAIDVGLLAGGSGNVHTVGHRVEHVEGVAADGVDELAIDVVLDA